MRERVRWGAGSHGRGGLAERLPHPVPDSAGRLASLDLAASPVAWGLPICLAWGEVWW